ncbi:MAG: hypothetical protein AB1458_10035 [Bacteroidota bacterium]
MADDVNIPDDSDNLEKYAPALAGIRKENPFVVPEGYFDLLPSSIRLALLRKENGGFVVPDDYFEELPGIIRDRIFLAGLKQDPDVPEGYFDTLADKIQGGIFISELPKENPFSVPENYFEELPGRIEARLALERIGKENPFAVPEGYFDRLPAAIEQKLDKKHPKIIPLFSVRSLGWAAAASVALLLALNLFRDKPVEISDNTIVEMAALEKTSIIENAELFHITESDVIEALEESGTSITGSTDLSEEDKEAIDFLLDNDIDISSIANE